MRLGGYIALIPVVGAYLVLYGAVDLLAYYNHFNIQIFSYVSISEVTLYFMKDLFYVIPFIMLQIIVYSLTVYYDSIRKKDGVLSDVQTMISRINKIKIKIGIILLISALFLALVIVINPLLGTLMVLSFLFGLAIHLANRDLSATTTVIIGLLMLSISYTSADIRAKLAWALTYGGELKIQGENVIKSDSVNYIVGKTENYVFFHRSKQHVTVIYPVSKLEYLIIPTQGQK